MKKIIGIAVFLLLLYAFMWWYLSAEGFGSAGNHFNLSRRIGMWGVLGLGICFLIITGNIDLSIGSLVGMCATLWALLTFREGMSPWLATLIVVGTGACVGLLHGLLVTKLKLQSFVVTLCGLFIYRGLARVFARDQSIGEGLLAKDAPSRASYLDFLRLFYETPIGPHAFLWICLALALVLAVLLHWSVYGRYLFAIGNNEPAARFSGIASDRYKIFCFILCSMLAALCSVMFVLENKSVQPSGVGSFFELYAIAAAVLGGCSLRGGEGTVVGVLIGTTIIVLLSNFAILAGVGDNYIPIMMGMSLLLGAVLDEAVRQGKFGQLRRWLAKGGPRSSGSDGPVKVP